ncbi:MAG: hypothetical protein M1814_005794 [Vezdaea aestivalis]|nr:MAG: hypothetical protein M1814_005794 [Vezdaea aestivalis]
MPVVQLSNPRKRRHSEQPTLQQNKASQHVCKRQGRSHLSGFQYPPAFWDNLSKIHLTKLALKELDRRNTQATLNSRQPYLRPDRRITRRVSAELKKSSQPLKSPAEYLRYCAMSDLKNIKQTARHGGPDLMDLRGLPNPSSPLESAMSLTQPKPTTNTTNTPSTSPYNRDFQQKLIDGSIYPEGYEFPDGRIPPQPANWETINQRLAQRRPSLSPSRFSDDEFRAFKRANALAPKEKQVIASVIPFIEGDIKDAKCVSGGIPLTSLDPLTDGTLVPGNPDIYYGARPEQLDQRVRNELRAHIIPSTQADLPIVPNFFLEVKGPDGLPAVAKRQASYSGALGARGIHSLQSYGQDNAPYFNNAYTVTSTYHDGTLKMFTSHPTQPVSSGSRPEYFMHLLNSWSMIGRPEAFRQAATYYRNGRDWAKEQRDVAIRQANEKVNEVRTGTLAIDPSFVQASSSAGEATSDGTHTIEALTEQIRTRAPENLTQTPRRLGHRPLKRRRLNTGDSDYDQSRQSGLQQSGSSGLSRQLENQDIE